MTDPWPILEEFSNYAHEYCINLNGMDDWLSAVVLLLYT